MSQKDFYRMLNQIILNETYRKKTYFPKQYSLAFQTLSETSPLCYLIFSENEQQSNALIM